MADPILEFDPAAESSGSPLTITTGNYGLTQFSAPSPPGKLQWAGSVDTEGSALAARGHENRVITIGLEVTGATALADLQSKLAKLHREGGTLKYTSPNATVATADVLVQDGFDPVFDHLHYLGGVTSCQFSLTCKPYLRGAEQDLGDNVETTLPYLVFTEASVPGDVEAKARLLIDNDATADQWWLVWGLESRYYSSSANAALFYEAEGRTPLNGAATAAGPSGASGGGSNVVRHSNLTYDYQAVVSTQATGGGAHLSHVGAFRVFARMQMPTTNTGAVTVALRWAEGDFARPNMNTAVTFDANHYREGQWILQDLGIVTLRPVLSGTQRWEGQILAKSTQVTDDIDIDYLLLVPVAEGSGIASGVLQTASSGSYTARDGFEQIAGDLTGKTAEVGGTWAEAGDPDGLVLDTTNDVVTRTAVSDASNPHFALAGSSTPSATVVQVDMKATVAPITGLRTGVLARYSSTSSNLAAVFDHGAQRVRLGIYSGTTLTEHVFTAPISGITADTWYTIRLYADTAGRALVWFGLTADTSLDLVLAFNSSTLATGGAEDNGQVGIVDLMTLGTAVTRSYDNFAAWVPVTDGIAYASQSAEVRSDGVRREDSSGSIWATASSYTGDYLFVPPSGAEGRTTRVIVKALRNDPAWGDDANFDDISARLLVIPRWLAPPA